MTIIKQSVTNYSQKWNLEFHLVEHVRKALPNRTTTGCQEMNVARQDIEIGTIPLAQECRWAGSMQQSGRFVFL
jgi:hypothetical protein